MDLKDFIHLHKEELIEALDNHIEEISSLIECSDTENEQYAKMNSKRNRLLRKFISLIHKTK